MKKELPNPEEQDRTLPVARNSTFRGAIDQIAKFLRSEVKLKDRASKTPPTGSLYQSIAKIARLLRTQIRAAPTSKKRTWNRAKRSSTNQDL